MPPLRLPGLNLPRLESSHRPAPRTRRWSVLHPYLLSLADERVAEEKARLILVVRAAAELDVLRRRRASRRVGRDVMELEERDLATPACASHERAASLIALPHCPPNGRRYVTSRCSTLIRTRPR